VVTLAGVPQTSSGYTTITRPLLSSTSRTIQATAQSIPTNSQVTINWYGTNKATPEATATATTGGVLIATTLLGGPVWTAGPDSSGAAIDLANWEFMYASVSVSSGTVTNLVLTVGV